MKKQIISILLILCMVPCFIPTVFAEKDDDETPQCICETACAADSMNTECPVCGAENAAPDSCGFICPHNAPADNGLAAYEAAAGSQPTEGSETDNSVNLLVQNNTQYEAALILGTSVTNYETVTAAVAAAEESENSGCTVRLLKNITLTDPLWVNKGTFTLDLAGFYLTGNFGASRATLRLGKESVADLTVMDSKSESNTGYIENSTGHGDSAAILAGGGKLTIENGRFLNGLQVDDKANVRINGGTFVRTRAYNFEWGASAGGFTVKVTDGRQVHELLREGYEFFYAKENRFVNCRGGKQYYEEELTLIEHTKHNSDENGKCDCGYVCPHNKFQDGICTACGSAAFVKLTDSIGSETKYFVTLSDAFNAVPNKSDTDTVYTVTVLRSQKLGSDWITVYNKRLTLDLGGQTLSQCLIVIKEKTELTVDGIGVMNDYSKIEVSGECELYVKSGEIESVSVASSTMGENGTVYLQGGTIGLSLYKGSDAVLTGGTLTRLYQSDFTAMGVAPSVLIGDIIPVGYALEYAEGYLGKLPRDTGIKYNDNLRQKMNVVPCDHSDYNAVQNDCCVYCGAENPIFYDLHGGSMNEPNPTFVSDEKDITLRNPIRNGYRFTGWSGTDLNGITQTVTIQKGSRGIRLFTAHWEEKNDFIVTFNTDGGNAIADKTCVRWNDNVLSGILEPTKNGFDFVGWKYENITVTPGTTYGELAKWDTVPNITVTAQWAPASYTVTMNTNGGTVNRGAVTGYTYGTIVELPADVTRIGYNFDGWYNNAELRGTAITAITAADTGNKTYYAKWMPKGGYTVTFNTDGGNAIAEKTDVMWTDKVLNGILEPTKNGFDFAGWRCGNIAVTPDTTYGELAKQDTVPNITVTAQWTENIQTTPANDEYNVKDNTDIYVHTVIKNEDTAESETKPCYGGTATCKEKAVCTVCGESYGELDPNKHIDLKYFAAKAATNTAEGNIEYWYCGGCGRYFSDAAATKEITEADTVTAKLPEDIDTLTQTKDGVNFALPIAGLFIVGISVAAVIIVLVIKKKRSAK